MKVDLLYGRGKLAVPFPDELRITTIRKNPMPVAPDATAALAHAFLSPVGCPPLRTLACGRRSACILICDITRPVPNGKLLPGLVDELVAAGVDRKDILILVATGLHRPNERLELREVIGSEAVFKSVRNGNHFARDREAHVELGRTPSGIPILIDRRFVEADLRIVVGLVEPHFMAGYSGGRKLVVPGVAHQDTILQAARRGDPGPPGRGQHGHRRQPAARRAAAHRARHRRGVRAECRDRRGAPDRVRELRADRAEPCPGRGVHAPLRGSAGRRAVQDGRHHQRRLPARQDVLPDDQGHGGGAGHPRARRDRHHRERVLGGHGQPRVRGRAARALSHRARAFHGRDHRPQPRAHRRVADADAGQGAAGRQACCSTRRGCGRPTSSTSTSTRSSRSRKPPSKVRGPTGTTAWRWSPRARMSSLSIARKGKMPEVKGKPSIGPSAKARGLFGKRSIR